MPFTFNDDGTFQTVPEGDTGRRVPTQANLDELGGGGGLTNPVTEPLVIEPAVDTSAPLQIIPPATLDPNAFVLNVKDITGADAFTVTGDGQVQIIPTVVSGNLLTIDDSRSHASEEVVILVSSPAETLSLFTSGLLRVRSRLASGGITVQQSTAADRPFQVTGSATSAKRFTVDGAGRYRTFAITAPADADVATSEMVVWFDNTNGAAKVMFKGKTADGTVVTGNVALA